MLCLCEGNVALVQKGAQALSKGNALLGLQFKCVNFHGFQGDRKCFLDSRASVKRRQRRGADPVAEIVGEEPVETELAALGRTVEADGREATVEAETVQHKRD